MTVDPGVAAGGLVAATALHLGFQLTVTLVVYPALARHADGDWASAHDAHSRAIVPIVVLVYAAVLLACASSAVVLRFGWGVGLALAGSGIALATTAFVAAPTHRHLTGNPDPALLRRLHRADVVRTVAAAVALAGALATLDLDAG